MPNRQPARLLPTELATLWSNSTIQPGPSKSSALAYLSPPPYKACSAPTHVRHQPARPLGSPGTISGDDRQVLFRNSNQCIRPNGLVEQLALNRQAKLMLVSVHRALATQQLRPNQPRDTRPRRIARALNLWAALASHARPTQLTILNRTEQIAAPLGMGRAPHRSPHQTYNVHAWTA